MTRSAQPGKIIHNPETFYTFNSKYAVYAYNHGAIRACVPCTTQVQVKQAIKTFRQWGDFRDEVDLISFYDQRNASETAVTDYNLRKSIARGYQWIKRCWWFNNGK